MQRSRVRGGLVMGLLIAGLVISSSAARAVSQHGSTAQSHRATAMTMPTTWHVIAGFAQMLPTGNTSTEAVNQFYPRTLTIHPGDKVTWTVNSANEPHIITFAPDPMLRHLEDPTCSSVPR